MFRPTDVRKTRGPGRAVRAQQPPGRDRAEASGIGGGSLVDAGVATTDDSI
jgi:hypothetical protein